MRHRDKSRVCARPGCNTPCPTQYCSSTCLDARNRPTKGTVITCCDCSAVVPRTSSSVKRCEPCRVAAKRRASAAAWQRAKAAR